MRKARWKDWRSLIDEVAQDVYVQSRFVSKKELTKIARVIFWQIVRDMQKGEEVRIPNFGRFVIKEGYGRKTTHPVTGERIEIPKQKVVIFKPAANMRRRLNKQVDYDRQRRKKKSENLAR